MSFETFHAPTTEVEDVLVTYRDPEGELIQIRAARALFDLTIANGSAEMLRVEEIGVRLIRPEILDPDVGIVFPDTVDRAIRRRPRRLVVE